MVKCDNETKVYKSVLKHFISLEGDNFLSDVSTSYEIAHGPGLCFWAMVAMSVVTQLFNRGKIIQKHSLTAGSLLSITVKS